MLCAYPKGSIASKQKTAHNKMCHRAAWVSVSVLTHSRLLPKLRQFQTAITKCYVLEVPLSQGWVCLFPLRGRILEVENCCVPAIGEAHQWAQAHFFVGARGCDCHRL